MKNKILIYFLALILILTGFWGFSSKIFKVQAQEPSDIYVKVEASLDNGASWHNYASTKNAGGETLTIKGGDIVLIRVKMWNEGTSDITDAIGEGYLSNTDYISNGELVSSDEDGNTTEYDGYFWGDSGTGIIDLAANGSESSGYESVTVRITIADNIPADTAIEGKVTVLSEGNEVSYNPFHKNFGISKVFAEGIGRYSICRMATASTLPQTGADL